MQNGREKRHALLAPVSTRRLIKEFTRVDDPGQAAGYGLDGPFSLATFDIVLAPEK